MRTSTPRTRHPPGQTVAENGPRVLPKPALAPAARDAILPTFCPTDCTESHLLVLPWTTNPLGPLLIRANATQGESCRTDLDESHPAENRKAQWEGRAAE